MEREEIKGERGDKRREKNERLDVGGEYAHTQQSITKASWPCCARVYEVDHHAASAVATQKVWEKWSQAVDVSIVRATRGGWWVTLCGG